MKNLKEIGLETPGHSKCENLELEDYLPIYDEEWSKIRNKPITMLEIGIGKKGSLRMWKEYFPNAQITGMDISDKCLKQKEERIEIIIGDQENAKFLNTLGNYDIIIDDGGHKMTQQVVSLMTLYPKANVWYVIEDLHTSYWPKFGDGATITGLKDLIDVVNWRAITHERAKGKRQRLVTKDVSELHFYEGICFIGKAIDNT